MNYWVAVASRNHVLRGKSENIMQVCHGKKSPLQRIMPGDWVVYYSPVEIFGESTPCRRFTAIGKVQNGEVYQVDMGDNFCPWRRKFTFFQAQETLVEPLIPSLTFIKNKKQWGYIFRFGLFKISSEDFTCIASHMGIVLEEHKEHSSDNTF